MCCCSLMHIVSQFFPMAVSIIEWPLVAQFLAIDISWYNYMRPWIVMDYADIYRFKQRLHIIVLRTETRIDEAHQIIGILKMCLAVVLPRYRLTI